MTGAFYQCAAACLALTVYGTDLPTRARPRGPGLGYKRKKRVTFTTNARFFSPG